MRRLSERQDEMWSYMAYDPQEVSSKTQFGVEMAIFIDYAMYRK